MATRKHASSGLPFEWALNIRQIHLWQVFPWWHMLKSLSVKHADIYRELSQNHFKAPDDKGLGACRVIRCPAAGFHRVRRILFGRIYASVACETCVPCRYIQYLPEYKAGPECVRATVSSAAKGCHARVRPSSPAKWKALHLPWCQLYTVYFYQGGVEYNLESQR